MNRTSSSRAILNAAMALTLATQAHGAVTMIEAGQTVSLSGITVAEDPSLSVIVADDFSQEFVIGDPAGDALVGILHSRVAIRDDTGQLDFSWRISGLSGMAAQISSIVVSGYEGWSVGVEWRIDTLGDIGPSDALRTIDDDSIGYIFAGPPFSAPDGSKACLARTEAFEYALTGTARINLLSGESVTLSTWAPSVPTPGALGLLGLAGVLAGRRRR